MLFYASLIVVGLSVLGFLFYDLRRSDRVPITPHVVYLKIRTILQGQLKMFSVISERMRGKRGLEIGGPSDFFQSATCPLYEVIGELSNAVYSGDTVWEGSRAEGKTFQFHPQREPGWNYILDGSNLHSIPNASFDFVLSCHNLEHLANPIKALKEWKRVLIPDGSLLLVLPDKRRTFDHWRPSTSVAHMITDYEKNVGEDDLTHVEEVLSLHDHNRDRLETRTFAMFEKRCRENFTNRCLHHHVFTLENASELLEAAGFNVIAKETAAPNHLVLLATLSLSN